jgi:hypothetical protein
MNEGLFKPYELSHMTSILSAVCIVLIGDEKQFFDLTNSI